MTSTTSRPDRWNVLASWVVVPALLAGLLLVQTTAFQANTSETFDEPTFSRLGYDVFRKGDFHGFASPMDPALPVLLEQGLAALRTQAAPDTPGWDRELPGLIRIARAQTSVVVGVPLVLIVYAWASRRRGWRIGLLGGGLTALSPTIVTAASLATTDACFALFALVALGALRSLQDRPSLRTYAGFGVAMGLAFGAKQSAVFLVPVLVLELILKAIAVDHPTGPRTTRLDVLLRRAGWVGARLVGLGAVAFVVNWALFGFGVGPRFDTGSPHVPLPIVVPMVTNLLPGGDALTRAAYRMGPPLPIETFLGLTEKAGIGHNAFLLGRYSFHGWWYFFPVAIALKSTPVELLALGLTVVLAFRRSTWVDPARRLWLGSIGVTLGLGMASAMNYGQRHMILVYPLSILLACDVLSQWRPRRPVAGAIVGGLLLAWQAWSIQGVAPHYLGYFNSFCGGPTRGYRYLVDSSLDWGQDLPSLRRALEARNYRRVALRYFGTASPEVHGLKTFDWGAQNDPVAAGCDWLAISATSLQEVYSSTHDLIGLFDPLPSERVGYSIFLYDLSDPRVREAVAEERRRRTPEPNP